MRRETCWTTARCRIIALSRSHDNLYDSSIPPKSSSAMSVAGTPWSARCVVRLIRRFVVLQKVHDEIGSSAEKSTLVGGTATAERGRGLHISRALCSLPHLCFLFWKCTNHVIWNDIRDFEAVEVQKPDFTACSPGVLEEINIQTVPWKQTGSIQAHEPLKPTNHQHRDHMVRTWTDQNQGTAVEV